MILPLRDYLPTRGPTFVNTKDEWKGTRIIFDIAAKGDKTELRFVHEGLLPRLECYNDCSDTCGSIVRCDLRSLITGGARQSQATR